jgi:hypothetical protein
MQRRRVASLVSAGLIISMLISATPAAASGGHRHHGRGEAIVRLDGLSSPKALAVKGFDVYVGQGWAGPPGPMIKYRTLFHRGAREISGPLSLTDIAFARDGAAWLLGSDLVLYRQRHPGGAVEPVLSLAEYQAGDPDLDDQDADPYETNPNGLAAIGKHGVLVVDAAGNDLIRVKPDGSAVTVARWTREEQSTAHLGPGFPPTLPAEAVPTTVAIGPDGWAYVGELVGFPGTPGAAKIWRVNPWAEDAVCSLDPEVARDCSVWKSGFTAIFDIAFNRTTGTLYVYEIAEEGWLAFEGGFPAGPFPPAVLLEVKRHSVRELARGELSQPGGVVVTPFGRVFVTDGMFGNGRLVEIKR